MMTDDKQILRKLGPNYQPIEGEAGRVKRALPATLSEDDYDSLIVGGIDAVGGALVAAGVMPASSTLVVLQRQFSVGSGKLDVLCAETGPGGSFERLVIIEDKLLKNPEARYKVLGQILRYAHDLRRMTADEVPAPQGADAGWLDSHLGAIETCLRDGRFLLIIVGDAVHSNTLSMIRWLRDELSPASLMEVAAMELAIFESGDLRLLVPRVASALVLERTVTVTVRVVGSDNELQRSEVLHGDVRPQRANLERSTADFYSTWETTEQGASEANSARAVVRVLTEGPPHLALETTASGAPVLVADFDGDRENVTVFRVQGPSRSLADSVHGLLRKEPELGAIIEAFRSDLVALGGKAMPQGRVHVPIGIAEKRAPELASVAQKFVDSLQAYGTDPIG